VKISSVFHIIIATNFTHSSHSSVVHFKKKCMATFFLHLLVKCMASYMHFINVRTNSSFILLSKFVAHFFLVIVEVNF